MPQIRKDLPEVTLRGPEILARWIESVVCVARVSKKLTPVLDENLRQRMNINHFGEYHHGKVDLRAMPGVLACFLRV